MANILVVGDGAIGLLFSYFLAKHHTVNILTKKAPLTLAFIAVVMPLQKKLTLLSSHNSN